MFECFQCCRKSCASIDKRETVGRMGVHFWYAVRVHQSGGNWPTHSNILSSALSHVARLATMQMANVTFGRSTKCATSKHIHWHIGRHLKLAGNLHELTAYCTNSWIKTKPHFRKFWRIIWRLNTSRKNVILILELAPGGSIFEITLC